MKLQNYIAFLFSLFAFILFGCVEENSKDYPKQSRFDFSDTIRLEEKRVEFNSTKEELKIAIAAITSPRETFNYYDEMFKYIERETGMRVNMIQKKTYEEINQLAKSNHIDIAFVCSGGYVYGSIDSSFQLLAMPLRDGKNKYQSYIITHKNSGIESLDDLQGKKFAFTDPLSTAGKLYPQKKLKEKGIVPCDFFSHTIYTYSHDNSIQLVAKQMVDGASVNSLVFDYLALFTPERVKNIKIIERSEWYAMPPIVVSNHVSENLKSKLEEIFFNIHNHDEAKEFLDKLLVDKYVLPNDSCYESVRNMVDFIEK
jgi:phosphonate transport system substrate-binding protein